MWTDKLQAPEPSSGALDLPGQLAQQLEPQPLRPFQAAGQVTYSAASSPSPTAAPAAEQQAVAPPAPAIAPTRTGPVTREAPGSEMAEDDVLLFDRPWKEQEQKTEKKRRSGLFTQKTKASSRQTEPESKESVTSATEKGQAFPKAPEQPLGFERPKQSAAVAPAKKSLLGGVRKPKPPKVKPPKSPKTRKSLFSRKPKEQPVDAAKEASKGFERATAGAGGTAAPASPPTESKAAPIPPKPRAQAPAAPAGPSPVPPPSRASSPAAPRSPKAPSTWPQTFGPPAQPKPSTPASTTPSRPAAPADVSKPPASPRPSASPETPSRRPSTAGQPAKPASPSGPSAGMPRPQPVPPVKPTVAAPSGPRVELYFEDGTVTAVDRASELHRKIVEAADHMLSTDSDVDSPDSSRPR